MGTQKKQSHKITPVQCTNVTVNPLKPTGIDAEYRLHLAAHEWSLANPIIIHDESDLESKHTWHPDFKPFAHQIRNLITFCRRLPVTLIADDVGLGKTISAGLILSELMSRRKVLRAMVICPSILGSQWVEELKVRFGIDAVFATGGKNFEDAVDSETSVVVSTYHTACPRLPLLPSNTFDMLIIDEAHKIRNLHGSPKTPVMATRIREALEASFFKYVLLLTATPIQNRLWDLYSLIDCLNAAQGKDHHPLGNPDEFKSYFLGNDKARLLRPGTEETFRGVLRKFIARTRRADANLVFPTRHVRLFTVPPTDVEIELNELVKGILEDLNGLEQSSVLRALFSSPDALADQITNMAKRRPDRWEAVSGRAWELAQSGRPAKIDGLLQIIHELQKQRSDWRLLVFTIRRATQRAIGRALIEAGVKFGFIEGGNTQGNRDVIERFHKDNPDINVIVSTDSGAEGVNLQVTNTLVNFDLPWNPMIVEQRIGRIQRLGSKYKHVVVFNLIVEGSVEHKIVATLMEKLQAVASTVGDVESILESTSRGQGDEGDQFESVIRDLVVKSLLGVNNDEAAKRIAESIEQAKLDLEASREEMDQNLGRLDELHDSGPSCPKLNRFAPSLSFEEFIYQMYAQAGKEIDQRGEMLYAAIGGGSNAELFTFDPLRWRDIRHRFPQAKLYYPGKTDFERHVNNWAKRSGQLINDITSSAITEQFVENWIRKIAGSCVLNTQIKVLNEHFSGQAIAKATVSNGVDSYEKLISVKVRETDNDQISSCALNHKKSMHQPMAGNKMAAIAPSIQKAVETDKDVNDFAGFYEMRLKDELLRIGDDSPQARRAKSDFQPLANAELVGLEGNCYQTQHITVTFAIDDQGSYSIALKAIPAIGEILEEPKMATCQVTNRIVPESCLSKCCVTNDYVLDHLLVKSSKSGRRALAAYTAVCEASGTRLISDELQKSDASNRLVDRDLLIKSVASNGRALKEELTQCEYTDDWVLPGELVVSDVTGMKSRIDQLRQSPISNKRSHNDDFVKCELTGDWVLPEETVTSDMSNRVIRHDRTVTSEQAPHRVGALDEMAVCDMTGSKLLSDEVGICSVSGKTVELSRLAKAEDGHLVLPDQLVKCEVSGKMLLPDQVAVSSVSGKRVDQKLLLPSELSTLLALPEEMVTCEFTGDIVLCNEVVTSDVSAKAMRMDEARTSSITGRIGHTSESHDLCDERVALLDEVRQSDVINSQEIIPLGEEVRSDKSGRYGSKRESVLCFISHKQLLIDEIESCAVTGEKADIDLMVRSDVSGKFALPDEVLQCEVTSKVLLPEEAGRSDVSGKLVEQSLLHRSQLSSRLGLEHELQKCEFSGDMVLIDETVKSDVSGKVMRKDAAHYSSISARVGHKSEIEVLPDGRESLVDEFRRSEVKGSKEIIPIGEEVRSEKSGRCGAKSEVITCSLSQRQLLIDEAERCAITGKRADVDLMAKSDVSGKFALPDEALQCEVTSKVLLPEESGRSDVSGKVVERSLLHQSQLSSRFGLTSELHKCDFTGDMVLIDEIVKSDFSGKCFRQDEAITSDLTGRIAHISESVETSAGKRALLDEVLQSSLSNKYSPIEKAAKSERSGRIGLPNEMMTCEASGRLLLRDEVARCMVSGKLVDSELLESSEASTLKCLPECMAICKETNRRLLPSEMGVCAESGWHVDKRLLATSDISGLAALPRYLKACVVTGDKGLPNELGACELTGDFVRPDLLSICCVTGKSIRKDKLVRSAVSGEFMSPTVVVRSVIDERPCMPDEAIICPWVGPILPGQSRQCAATGFAMAEPLISKSTGEFRLIQMAFDGKVKAQRVSGLERWLKRESGNRIGNVKSMFALRSPKGHGILLVGTFTVMADFLFGPRPQRFAALIQEEPRVLLGHVCIERKTKTGWVRISTNE